MNDDSNEKLLDEGGKTVISNATMTAIIILTNEIEGYMRQYLDKGGYYSYRIGFRKFEL